MSRKPTQLRTDPNAQTKPSVIASAKDVEQGRKLSAALIGGGFRPLVFVTQTGGIEEFNARGGDVDVAVFNWSGRSAADMSALLSNLNVIHSTKIVIVADWNYDKLAAVKDSRGDVRGFADTGDWPDLFQTIRRVAGDHELHMTPAAQASNTPISMGWDATLKDRFVNPFKGVFGRSRGSLGRTIHAYADNPEQQQKLSAALAAHGIAARVDLSDSAGVNEYMQSGENGSVGVFNWTGLSARDIKHNLTLLSMKNRSRIVVVADWNRDKEAAAKQNPRLSVAVFVDTRDWKQLFAGVKLAATTNARLHTDAFKRSVATPNTWDWDKTLEGRPVNPLHKTMAQVHDPVIQRGYLPAPSTLIGL